MGVLVYIDNANGKFPKSGLEAIYFASKMDSDCTAITIGDVSDETCAALGNYGAKKVLKVTNPELKDFDSQAYTRVVAQAFDSSGAGTLVFANNVTSKSIAPRLSVRLKAGLVTGVIEFPKTDGDFTVKRTSYSGKGFAHVTINTDKKILAIQPNSFSPETSEQSAEVETMSAEAGEIKTKVMEVNAATDKIPLTEASLVVSGGRGLKGPENWGMVEELAGLLGAGTACSRPVSDTGWRPHSEHVGQTGITIRPNLYIAIGISGAIQHLAGVNGSKTIVVINKDPEAPFFKAADYGIVGDAFEVVPKLIDAVKNFNSAS